MSDDIVTKQFMHSCYVRTKTGDAVVVKEQTLHKDGTTTSRLAEFINPRRSFYITNTRYRSYKYKTELEQISKLDKYTVPNWDMRRKLAEVLGLRPGYLTNAQLFKSPYVFGADISIEALIKMNYMNTYPDPEIKPTYGFLDIETSIENDEIMLISYITGSNVYIGILEHWLWKEVEKDGKKIKVKVEFDEINKFVNEKLQTYADNLTVNKNVTQEMIDGMRNLKYNIKILSKEIDLIAWTFLNIHNEKADFIGIWNMNFDIPRILSRIAKAKVPAEVIFSDPNLTKSLRYLKYREDVNPNVAHFTLKWHTLQATCTSQFIDSMGLFSQCRRTNGFRNKYTLDSVLDDELGLGKLPLAPGQSHIIMQQHHFMDYVVYNAFDVIGLYLLEQKNNDLFSMSVLAGPTPVNQFSLATIKTANNLYNYYIQKGMVLSSVSREDNFVKLDRLFKNAGGSVLPPERVANVGVPMRV